MSLTERIDEIRNGFKKTFWIANTLELFERLAFYGAKAVLTVYLAEKVGLTEDAGKMAGVFSGVIYLLPVLAGVLVDRYGFRRTLMACFFIFALGYFAIGLAGMAWGEHIVALVGRRAYMWTVLMLTAVGGSLIKPCIVGTVAITSKPDARALGFSIYYTLVNFGGAIGPILAMTVRQNLGIEFVLMVSALTSALLFVGTLIFFPEPVPDEPVAPRTFGRVFSDMVLVFGNIRFMLFLVIFSGFWIMFWQIFYSFPFYVKDVLHYEKFEILETVDAFGIIVLTMPIAALVKKWNPFRAMIVGFVLASLSWLIIGAVPTVWGAILGVFVYAIGEATQAPRFYDYVSRIAPASQVGTYMGFAFLPVAIGSFAAGPLADYLRTTWLPVNPAMMWYITSAIGVGCTVLIILYDRFVAPAKTKS